MTAVSGPLASMLSMCTTPLQLDHVRSLAPYIDRPDRDTTNDTDEIFSTGGDPTVGDIASAGNGDRAAICLVLLTPEGTS